MIYDTKKSEKAQKITLDKNIHEMESAKTHSFRNH